MQELFYPLLADFVFKQIFGDPKYTANLALLLESVLPLQGEELGKLTIEKTFIERSHSEDKLVIFDIKVVTGSGKVIDVELQVQKTPFFSSRLVFYKDKLVVEQAGRGRHYGRIRPVYCVAICNFIMLPKQPGYIHHICLCDAKSGAVFTDLENLIIIELPKMSKISDGSKGWPVLECFRCKTVEEAEMHAKVYPAIKDIVAGLRGFSLTKEFRMAYDQYMIAREDRKLMDEEIRSQCMREGREEGIEKGIEKGRVEGRKEGMTEGAARERKKWEALMSEKEAELQTAKAALSENEAMRRELERLRQTELK